MVERCYTGSEGYAMVVCNRSGGGASASSPTSGRRLRNPGRPMWARGCLFAPVWCACRPGGDTGLLHWASRLYSGPRAERHLTRPSAPRVIPCLLPPPLAQLWQRAGRAGGRANDEHKVHAERKSSAVRKSISRCSKTCIYFRCGGGRHSRAMQSNGFALFIDVNDYIRHQISQSP